MDVKLLKIVLRRFMRSDYSDLVDKWPPLQGGLPNVDVTKISSIPKSVFVEAVAHKLKREVSSSLVADLDLLYLQRHSRRLWKVFKLDKIPGKNPHDVTTAEKFVRRLRRQITSYLDADVHIREQHEAYWLRISIQDGRPPVAGVAPRSLVYVVHVPGTEYVIVTGLKLVHMDYIMQSFLTVMHGHRASDVHLSGHHLVSLLQLVFSKHAESSEGTVHGEPHPTAEDNLPDGVVNENRGQKRRREQYTADNFGPNKQPRLEKVEYKLETKFKGQSHVPMMSKFDKVFHCRVKFEGTSVLEGIRNLAEAGLAEIPMKSHLGRVHSMAKNMFLLKQNTKS